MLRIENRAPAGIGIPFRLWMLAILATPFPLMVGAWLSATDREAPLLLDLIGMASIIAIVNLIIVPWAMLQDRRYEIGPEGIDLRTRMGRTRIPWSQVRWVHVRESPIAPGRFAFWIGGLRRRFFLTADTSEGPEAVRRLTSAIARYAPHAQRKGRIQGADWNPARPTDGEFAFGDSHLGGMWLGFSLVATLGAVVQQLALAAGSAIIPSAPVWRATVLVYFLMATAYVSSANWMLREGPSMRQGQAALRFRRLARIGGGVLIAVSTAATFFAFK